MHISWVKVMLKDCDFSGHSSRRIILIWIVDGILEERRKVSGDTDKERWVRGDTGV
jgi:hypothetical protein